MTTKKTAPSRPLPLLSEAALRDFIGAGSVTKLEAVGRPGGFDLRVHMGTTEALLGNSRGGIRAFASLVALSGLLQRLEHPRFEVDATNYVRGLLRKPGASKAVAQKPIKTVAPKTAVASKSRSQTWRKQA